MNHKILFLVFSAWSCSFACAQAKTYDVFSYSEPAGWKKEVNKTGITYTATDINKGIYCVIGLNQHSNSEGNLQADFEKQWQMLIATPFGVSSSAKTEKAEKAGDWETMSGVSTFMQGDGKVIAMLTTVTGFNQSANIIFLTNDQAYISQIEGFTNSLNLLKPAIDMVAKNEDLPVQNTGSLTGEWSSNSTTLADFVTASGQYAGDASITSTTIFVFNANGTYEDRFNIFINGKFHFYTYKGNYTKKGDQLTLKPAWYQHKVNAKEVKDNNPNNLKTTIYHFAVEYDQAKNKNALKLVCAWDACVSPGDLYQVN